MKLFWKIFISVSILFAVAITIVSYVTTYRQVRYVKAHIMENNGTLAEFLSKEIVKGYAEARWPFESLQKLAERKDFLFWWIVRDDGSIYLSDDASFAGTSALEYFPQLSGITSDESVIMDEKRNAAIVSKTIDLGNKKWSFLLGFSTKEISQINKSAIVYTIVLSMFVFFMTGGAIYFIIDRFTSPIKDLNVGTTELGKGNLTYRVKVRSHDELGLLAEAFNKMVIDLKNNVTSIETLNNEIVERKKAEEELRSSEERLKILFENAPDAYYLNDLKGNFIDGNKAAEGLTGYKKEELIRKNFAKILPADQLPKALNLVARNALGFSTGPDEFILNKKDGTQVTAEISTHPVSIKGKTIVLGIARDVSERIKMTQQLKKAASEWGNTFDAITDIVTIISPDYEFININKAGLAASGKKKEELIGKKCYEVIHGLKEPIIGCPCKETIRTKMAGTGEISDRGRYYAVTADPILDEKGELVSFVLTVKDINERKKAEIERENLLHRVEDANKKKTEFVSDVSHELRTPLASIKGFISTIRSDKEMDEKTRVEFMKIVEDETDRLTRIIEELLDISRIES